MITKYKPRRFSDFHFPRMSLLGVISRAENEPNPRAIHSDPPAKLHFSRLSSATTFASLKTATEKLDKMEREHHITSTV
jgi:hypothetical protein